MRVVVNVLNAMGWMKSLISVIVIIHFIFDLYPLLLFRLIFSWYFIFYEMNDSVEIHSFCDCLYCFHFTFFPSNSHVIVLLMEAIPVLRKRRVCLQLTSVRSNWETTMKQNTNRDSSSQYNTCVQTHIDNYKMYVVCVITRNRLLLGNEMFVNYSLLWLHVARTGHSYLMPKCLLVTQPPPK